MEIGPLISRTVLTVWPGNSLLDAARRMRERGIGSAVVMGDNGPGIITERDILRAVAEGVDLREETVERYMTYNARTAGTRWDLMEAAKAMSEGGFRHLIVVDDSGDVAGVMSIRDLVKGLLIKLDSANVLTLGGDPQFTRVSPV